MRFFMKADPIGKMHVCACVVRLDGGGNNKRKHKKKTETKTTRGVHPLGGDK